MLAMQSTFWLLVSYEQCVFNILASRLTANVSLANANSTTHNICILCLVHVEIKTHLKENMVANSPVSNT